MGHGRADDGAARLSQLQSAVGIAVHEHFFDGHFIRTILDDQRQHGFMDLSQPAGKIVARRPDAAAGDVLLSVKRTVDHTETGTQ